MVVDIGKYKGFRVDCSERAYNLMKGVFMKMDELDRDRENAWVICLNKTNRVIEVEWIAIGCQDMVLIDPKEVFCRAIRIRAAKVVLIHNHPSGSCFRSGSDILNTDNLIKAGDLICIPMLDHLIISEDDYFSFGDCGMIDVEDEVTKLDI